MTATLVYINRKTHYVATYVGFTFIGQARLLAATEFDLDEYTTSFTFEDEARDCINSNLPDECAWFDLNDGGDVASMLFEFDDTMSTKIKASINLAFERCK